MMVKPSVLVAMSGGVDSSVAAALLVQGGYRCHGVFMQLHDRSDCTDARRVAEQLGIDLDILDCRTELQQIIDYFLAEYRLARTPNPCIQCNRRLKFGRLFDYARDSGIDGLATGHYARIVEIDGQHRLTRGLDSAKDQSYALFGIDPEKLKYILFPLGEYHKQDIRELARRMQLPVHDKDESQEICFVPDDDYISFLIARDPGLVQPGRVVDTAGKTLGEHEGVFRYTIGQRRGLGIALGEPAYVVKLDAVIGEVTLGGRQDLMKTRLIATDAVWHVAPSKMPFRAEVQIRYNHKAVPAVVSPLADHDGIVSRFQVDFDDSVPAITPGQAAVCYDHGGHVLVGGWIDTSEGENPQKLVENEP